jgi:DNA-directed RNA polymerase specialized sigma24 family protein
MHLVTAAPDPDREMAAQLERIVRKVKRSMRYRGSFSTRDILGSLVARWVQSGEWARLRALPPAERRVSESVRRFILDRLEQLRRRGVRAELDDDVGPPIQLPDERTLGEMIELAELRAWIAERVAELEAGVVDARVRIPLAQPVETGRALRQHLAGRTQREIAAALGLSLGAVNKRLAEGTSYLAVVQAIEEGLA